MTTKTSLIFPHFLVQVRILLGTRIFYILTGTTNWSSWSINEETAHCINFYSKRLCDIIAHFTQGLTILVFVFNVHWKGKLGHWSLVYKLSESLQVVPCSCKNNQQEGISVECKPPARRQSALHSGQVWTYPMTPFEQTEMTENIILPHHVGNLSNKRWIMK